MCHVYRSLYYLVCVFDVYDQISFSFSLVFPQSVQWRLGHWNLTVLRLSQKCAWPLARDTYRWGTFGVPGHSLRKHTCDRMASEP